MYRIFTLLVAICCFAVSSSIGQDELLKADVIQKDPEVYKKFAQMDRNSAEYQLASMYTDLSLLLEGKSLEKDEAKVNTFISAYNKVSANAIEDDKFAHLMYMRLKATDFKNYEDHLLIILDYFMTNRDFGNKALMADKQTFKTNYVALAYERIMDTKMPEEQKAERAKLEEMDATRTTYKEYYQASIDEAITALKADANKMALYNGIVKFHQSHNLAR